MLLSYFDGAVTEAGCDEAGRGCLAGPVFAAAVVLRRDFCDPMLDDSKKLSEKQRYALRGTIEREALAWSVEAVPVEEIDRINILNASFLAMSNAVRKLGKTPGLLLIDGHMFRSSLEIPFKCIVKGDGKYASIAAASILAKTWRDDHMRALHEQFPEYGWDRNKGYPTLEHRKAIAKYGLTPHHRLTFNSSPLQQSLF